ncbi:MAG TPA: hypothetical protein DEB06_08615, partial [Phycisphaerales bacterium]|nr:hypothetical protein [Phycisphaerales bacterium]
TDESGAVRTLLVVEQGKFGAQRRLEAHDGARVTLSGWLLERDGRRIIELEPDAAAITPTPGSTPGSTLTPGEPVVAPGVLPLGEASFQGEIVDLKCFLGAMKPGDGRAHKACATLCIRNGIPPMLVAPRSDGSLDYILLTDSAGRSARALVLGHIADPVTVRGVLSRRADLLWLAIDDRSITPR